MLGEVGSRSKDTALGVLNQRATSGFERTVGEDTPRKAIKNAGLVIPARRYRFYCRRSDADDLGIIE